MWDVGCFPLVIYSLKQDGGMQSMHHKCILVSSAVICEIPIAFPATYYNKQSFVTLFCSSQLFLCLWWSAQHLLQPCMGRTLSPEMRRWQFTQYVMLHFSAAVQKQCRLQSSVKVEAGWVEEKVDVRSVMNCDLWSFPLDSMCEMNKDLKSQFQRHSPNCYSSTARLSTFNTMSSTFCNSFFQND